MVGEMKTRAEINALIYTILTALMRGKDCPLHGVPNGHIFAQLCDLVELGEWNIVVSIMKDAQWITETNHLLQITPVGEALYAKMDEFYQKG